MNALMNTMGEGPQTMTSIEIAELCEKRHDNVMRDIKTMISELKLDLLSFEGIYSDAHGRPQKCCHLPRDLTMTLITGYSIPLRKKVIDRLDELERRQSVTLDLNDPASLRALLLDNVNKVLGLQHQIEEMQPALEALDRISEAHGSFNRTTAAKNLGVAPQILIRWMRTNGWTYHRPGTTEDLAYQSKIAAGYLEHKISTGPRPDGTEWVSTQVRVTPKGLVVLAKAFPGSAREVA